MTTTTEFSTNGASRAAAATPRVALITGASRGLGRTLAAFLAPQGYTLILTARGADALAAVAEELRDAFGARVTALAGDVADPAHRRALAAAIAGAGRLDLLVNNASILGPSPQPELAIYPLETLEQVFAANVLAPLGLAQEVLPWLERAHGLVVNVSSDAAVGGYPGWGGYGASKAALDLLTLTLANEWRGRGVAFVAVDPGDMRTRMQQEAFPGEDISDRPLPDVTLPFWAWLLAQERAAISGLRFQAQATVWQAAL
jgi:NAD(P)-dependent dehydrogenase (short-subunit alcohol dehydrogenase family)